MKGKRYTTEQKIRVLPEAAASQHVRLPGETAGCLALKAEVRGSSRPLQRPSDQGDAPQSRLDLGLRSRHHDVRRNASHAQYPRRVHSGMPMRPRGSPDQRPQGQADYVRVDRAPWSARAHPQRQRFGVHRTRATPLACRE